MTFLRLKAFTLAHFGDRGKAIGKLKCKLIKIIRGSIRLLQGFYRQRCNDVAPPLPKMIDIDEDKVKLLIGSPYLLLI